MNTNPPIINSSSIEIHTARSTNNIYRNTHVLYSKFFPHSFSFWWRTILQNQASVTKRHSRIRNIYEETNDETENYMIIYIYMYIARPIEES